MPPRVSRGASCESFLVEKGLRDGLLHEGSACRLISNCVPVKLAVKFYLAAAATLFSFCATAALPGFNHVS